MKVFFKKLNDILSWAMLIGAFVLFIYTGITVAESNKTGKDAFVFGFRPRLVQSGSMEPYMMTNGFCLTKEVNDIEELEVGDVVTFHLEQNGKKMSITHRIISIEDGIINTQGDNNKASDDYLLTMDNIDAKVVCVFNQTAWLADKWQTPAGKVIFIGIGFLFSLGYFLRKSFIKRFFFKMEQEEPVPLSNVDKESGVNEIPKPESAEAPVDQTGNSDTPIEIQKE